MTRAIVVALAVAGGMAMVQTVRLERERTAHADTRTQHAEMLAASERAAREAVEAARTEEQRRTEEVQKAADEAHEALERARADAAAASTAGQRLRDRIAAITAGCRAAPGHPSPAGGGPPADATADLLADVQRRIDEAADGVAGFADLAHAAGRACERGYDALTRQAIIQPRAP